MFTVFCVVLGLASAISLGMIAVMTSVEDAS